MTLPLKNAEIPSVGFGTFNSFCDHAQVACAVKCAIKVGYRHFDLAKAYENEAFIGTAIAETIDAGVVKREELFLSSKLWCSDLDPVDVRNACQESMNRLKVDYLDCYLIHWPVQFNKDSTRVATEYGGDFRYEIIHSGDMTKIGATWKAMEALVDEGLVKSIGVSNFNVCQLRQLLDSCRIAPVCNEIELHPYLQQQSLVDYCLENNIQVTAYSPLGKTGYKDPGDPNLLQDSVIMDIAQEVNKTPAQVLLRWAIQRGTKVIPKSLTPSRIQENLDVIHWRLSETQMSRIRDLERDHRFVRVSWYNFDDEVLSENDESEGEISSASGSLTPLTQPKVLAGTIEGEVYKNNFYRPGRELRSEIIIERGILNKLATRARDIIPEKCHQAMNYLVTDTIVDNLFGEKVLQGIITAGLRCTKIVVPADTTDETGETSCERHKTLRIFEKCCDQILAQGISKNSAIISLGGGVINNLCGFLASCLYRGIALVHFTTTMMGMTDAAIDFKQAVNHSLGKNLIGAYYPADCIVVDPTCLKYLSERHILNGIAEALKHAIAQSKYCVETIVDPLRKNHNKALRDSKYLERVCRSCIDWKVPTLIYYHNSDFNEMVPQYGHSFGHAIEHLSYLDGQTPLLHGEAVAIGMCLSAEVSYILGFCDKNTVDQHYSLISDAHLPVFIPEKIPLSKIVEKMAFDKHFVTKPTMGLPQAIGEMKSNEQGSFAFTIELEIIMKALQQNVVRRNLNINTDGSVVGC